VSTPLPLALYGAATSLLEPFAPAILRGRARRGKEDPTRLSERLGRPGVARPAGGLAWLHGVSVGETTSLLPLVAALRARRPDLRLLVTSGTVTAARLLAQRLPDDVVHQFAPVDAPGAVRGFLDHWRPDVAVFVESELWPNLIQAAKARGVRLALLSARMTQASADRWAAWPASARALVGAFDLVLPQDAATDARLRRLGAAPGPQLNLKRVGEPLPCDAAELARQRTAVGARKVVLAASTHPGEETLIAEAFRAAVADLGEAVLVVAPRHPERGPELAQSLGATRRGSGEPPSGAIHVADTLGELGLFFSLADIVVMGGGFAPGIGGHNPLEPARMGRPILTGPQVFNAADVYAEMCAEACAIEAADGAALARHIRGLLDNPMIARRMGEAALAYARRQGKALDRAMAQLEPLLPA
jgi:3-deoxy-D-manno-octulosonic-acid transferase